MVRSQDLNWQLVNLIIFFPYSFISAMRGLPTSVLDIEKKLFAFDNKWFKTLSLEGPV